MASYKFIRKATTSSRYCRTSIHPRLAGSPTSYRIGCPRTETPGDYRVATRNRWDCRNFPFFDLPGLPQPPRSRATDMRSEEHTSELQSLTNLVCRLLL